MTTVSMLTGGTAHAHVPEDLAHALEADETALKAWHSITPLARNEWICWVLEPKRDDTRARRVERTARELAEGVRRSCCWIGCIHRSDKTISPSVQWALNKRARKSL